MLKPVVSAPARAPAVETEENVPVPVVVSAAPEIENYNSYTVSLDITPMTGQVIGVEKIKFRNTSADMLECICFNVYENAFREGTETEPFFEEFKEKIFKYKEDYADIQFNTVTVLDKAAEFELTDTTLTVELEKPLAPQESMEIMLQFEAYVPELCHRTGGNYYAMWCGNFLPTLAVYANGTWQTNPYYRAGEPFFSEVANYTVDITTPLNYIVAATGRSTAKVVENKKITSYQTKLVRDFAFVLSDRFKVTNWTSESGPEINLFYYSELDDKQVSELLKRANDSLRYYAQTVGDYPYRQLNIAECELFSENSMAYPAIIFMDSDNLSKPSALEALEDGVARQWFYNLIGTDQRNNAWLSNGLAELTQKEISYDSDSLYVEMYNEYKALEARQGNADNTALSQNLGKFTSWADYEDIETTRASLMMYSLKLKMGFARYSEFIKAYGARYSFKIVSKEDFIALAEEFYGGSLEQFFDDWLYEKELPLLANLY